MREVARDTNLLPSHFVFACHGQGLAYPKFKLAPDQRHDLLADHLPWIETMRMPTRPPRVPACRDPHDLPFLQLAFASAADALVSGDADLLVLATKSRIPILTPAQAITRLSSVGPYRAVRRIPHA